MIVSEEFNRALKPRLKVKDGYTADRQNPAARFSNLRVPFGRNGTAQLHKVPPKWQRRRTVPVTTTDRRSTLFFLRFMRKRLIDKQTEPAKAGIAARKRSCKNQPNIGNL